MFCKTELIAKATVCAKGDFICGMRFEGENKAGMMLLPIGSS